MVVMMVSLEKGNYISAINSNQIQKALLMHILGDLFLNVSPCIFIYLRNRIYLVFYESDVIPLPCSSIGVYLKNELTILSFDACLFQMKMRKRREVNSI